jgi:ATP-dependent Clp protease ATP-binding subunit ClpA
MFERFTDQARECVTQAQDEARKLGHGYIGTEHLLVAVCAEKQGLGGHVLRQHGVTPEGLRDDIVRIIGRGGPDPDALATIGIDLDAVRARVEETFGPGALDPWRGGRIPFTPRSKKALELALRTAVHLGDNFIASEHLLLGLARTDDGVAARMLSERGLTLARLEQAVDQARPAA